MQWDWLKTFETVARLGSLTAAAKALKVSQSTVSRHVSHLEEHAGSPLLLRQSPIQLTQRGAALADAIKPMVDAALNAQATLEETQELHGEVVVATVGEIARWMLARRLSGFYRLHPHLRLRILVGNHISSLASGEADIALRMVRPTRGELVARKVHTEVYGFFMSKDQAPTHQTPWLGLAGSLAQIPEQRYIERAFEDRPPRLLVEDLETMAKAAESGLGVTLISQGVAALFKGLVRVEPEELGAVLPGPMPRRDVWMVVHRSKQHLPRVRVVMDWLVSAHQNLGVKER